jgi:hypothetical protein
MHKKINALLGELRGKQLYQQQLLELTFAGFESPSKALG